MEESYARRGSYPEVQQEQFDEDAPYPEVAEEGEINQLFRYKVDAKHREIREEGDVVVEIEADLKHSYNCSNRLNVHRASD